MPNQKLMFPSVFLPFIHLVLLSCTSFLKRGQHSRSAMNLGGNGQGRIEIMACDWVLTGSCSICMKSR